MNKYSFLWIFIAILLLGSRTQAQSISPTRVEINPELDGLATVRITNSHAVQIPLELTIVDYSNPDTEGAAESKLLISPPQLLMESATSSQITLTWSDNSPLSSSQSYYLNVEELSLNDGTSSADNRIQLLTTLRIPVHISSGGEPSLHANSVKVGSNAYTELLNTGDKYALFSEFDIVIGVVATATRQFSGILLAEYFGRDAILPGETLVIPQSLVPLNWKDGQAPSVRIRKAR